MGPLANMAYLCYLSAMLTKRKKQNEIGKTRRHDTDTGSPEVQVAILTRRIEELSAHLDKNRKDKHSRRGLLGLVADRRKHLKYLEETNKRGYSTLVKKLGLKK
ncbi:MAG: 30S ribosomal protein S15 [Parcubacteria group bacterium Athens0416_74]|nr:MAG: 30S ribosomal protein S15 [Parcubacteria group bacterium Athens0416_74]